jgi:uncharacterized membrane protein YeaQ/YmgE (transglycosylase-associated protein family)
MTDQEEEKVAVEEEEKKDKKGKGGKKKGKKDKKKEKKKDKKKKWFRPSTENPWFSNTKKGKDKMINLIVVIIVGAIIGWVASKIMRTQGGLLVDIVVGIVGALLASFLFGRATLTSGSFAVVSLLWSLLGAIIVLAIYRLFSRGRRVSA